MYIKHKNLTRIIWLLMVIFLVIILVPLLVFSTENTGNTPFIPGDVNNDGVITAADVGLLRAYLAGFPTTINRQAADVNADGQLTAADIALLRAYLASFPVTLLPGTYVPNATPTPNPGNNDERPDELFHAVYRNDVIVFAHPPIYSFIMYGDSLIITIYFPCNKIMQLDIGDIFVFESTETNPGGISGHVLYLANIENTVVITAQAPENLEYIFYEFHVSNAVDLLSLGAEIMIAYEYANIEGIEVGRNPDSLFYIRFADFSGYGFSLSGELTLHKPEVNYDISFHLIQGLNLRLIELATTANIEVVAKYDGSLDRIITPARIRIPIKGIFVDIPIGVRVVATGQAEATFEASVEARFGIRNNNPFFSRTVNYEFGFDFTGRLELMAHLELRVSILGLIGIYGIYGNIGLGLETSTAILNICPENSCFVVGSNIILRLGSINDMGLAAVFSSLRFGPIYFFPNEPTTFHYYYNGNWHRACPHRLEQIDISWDLLGRWEGSHTAGSLQQREPRGNFIELFHDGFGYRAFVHAFPIEGSTLSRVAFYANVSYDGDTGEFTLTVTSIVYNPDGRAWGLNRWEGIRDGDTITGTTFTSPGGFSPNRPLGPFVIHRISD